MVKLAEAQSGVIPQIFALMTKVFLCFWNMAAVQHPRQRQCWFTEGTATKPICRGASSACELDTWILQSQQVCSRVQGGKAVAHVKPVSAVCGVRVDSCFGQPHAWETPACQVWCNRQQLSGLCLLALPCCTFNGLFPTSAGFGEGGPCGEHRGFPPGKNGAKGSLGQFVPVPPKTLYPPESSCDFHLCFTPFRAPAFPIAAVHHTVSQPSPPLAALGFLLG